jgi:hypothetical protein
MGFIYKKRNETSVKCRDKDVWGLSSLNKNIFITRVEENDKIKIPDECCINKESICFEITEDQVFLI